MNTYSRSQGMDNRLNMLFNQELDNEAQYIKSHPFSSINMSLGGEVRYIAPVWPWNAPRFQAIDWRTQPPPERIPGNTKHDRGNRFTLPKTWNETTNMCWSQEAKPPACFPYAPIDSRDGTVVMTAGAKRSATHTHASSRAPPSPSTLPPSTSPPDNPPPDSQHAAPPPPFEPLHPNSRPPTHPRLSSGSARSRPESHGMGGRDRDLEPLRAAPNGTPGSRPNTNGSRPPTERSRPSTNGSRPPTHGSRPQTNGEGGPPVDALRLNLPVSMLPGRPKTNGSNPRLSVRSNGSARRVAQEMVEH